VGSNFIIAPFIFFFVPETKDRTLEEIDEMFEARVSARNFKGYQCIISKNARQTGLGIADAKNDTGERGA
jgi:hypothetical protein